MSPTPANAATPERIDRFRGEHAFLSNFHRAPFEWQGQVWSTSEAAFQAAKTHDDRLRQRIRQAPSPAAAKRLGRRADLRPDWEDVKDDVMHAILQAKFAMPQLRDALLATGDAELVEGNTWGDVYWGVCRGRGRNRLGQILMRVRDDLRARDPSATHRQHAEWLRRQCERERTGRCHAGACHRRAASSNAAGPTCIPLEILHRLNADPNASTTS